MRHYLEGDYRNAMLDGMLALSGFIRHQTGLEADGNAIATEASSLGRPRLIFSEPLRVRPEFSEKFMEMIADAYAGIRNQRLIRSSMTWTTGILSR
ncbi:TIGR02391 family protein [Luteimonas suaedae]|uniref:TIGR02391 family protein n=1 Tax=Luteimonas suaedae TaxID=2605430 RepID=UPI0011EE3201|nr:TIGR02391 family protein [Luteimonas suaedae]